MVTSATAERQLVARVAQGDEEAAAELYRLFSGRLYAFIYRQVGGDPSLGEEVLQDTFLAAVRSAGRFREESTVFTWLCGIAWRQAADRNRRARRRRQVLEGHTAEEFMPLSGAPQPEEEVQREETRAWVRQIVESLPDRYRSVLLLKYVEELSTQEIAQITGRSIRAVESLLLRARATFREHAELRGDV